MVTPKRLKKIQTMQANRLKNVVVVLENLYDPHNASAIFRSCDAFGVGTVCVVCETVPVFDPTIVGSRSSGSANKWIETHFFTTTTDCLDYLSNQNFSIVSTVLNDKSSSLSECSFSDYSRLALCFGNEKNGVSNALQSASNELVMIPMKGMVQSLNVSNTAAICLYELRRQNQ